MRSVTMPRITAAASRRPAGLPGPARGAARRAPLAAAARPERQQAVNRAGPKAAAPLALHERLRAALARAGAPAAASLLAALGGLLAPGAARALDALPPYDSPFSYDVGQDLIDADLVQPELLDVMVVVVITYVGLMALYLWLASMIDEEADGAAGGSSSSTTNSFKQQQQQQPPSEQQQQQQQEGAPGYDSMLQAHVRSTREPPPRRSHELVAPAVYDYGGLAGLKAALAGQAADYVAAQVRECGAVVRRKLYLRRLTARDAHAPHGAAQHHAPHSGVALLLSEPGQMEALVDEALDNMPADVVNDDAAEATIIKSITHAVAARLAAAEAGELVRSMQAAVVERGPDADTYRGAFGTEIW